MFPKISFSKYYRCTDSYSKIFIFYVLIYLYCVDKYDRIKLFYSYNVSGFKLIRLYFNCKPNISKILLDVLKYLHKYKILFEYM